jgi:hypothetical protein
MTIEAANIILNARDDMTGVEIALVTVIRNLQKRVEELEREKADREHALSTEAGCTTERQRLTEDPGLMRRFRTSD